VQPLKNSPAFYGTRMFNTVVPILSHFALLNICKFYMADSSRQNVVVMCKRYKSVVFYAWLTIYDPSFGRCTV
jgi:hypothetical protein